MSRHDIRTVRRKADALSYAVSSTKGGHVRFRLVSGATVIAGKTPSDRRSLQNALATLRRVARSQAGNNSDA